MESARGKERETREETEAAGVRDVRMIRADGAGLRIVIAAVVREGTLKRGGGVYLSGSGIYELGFGLPARSFVRNGHTVDPSTNAIGITR